MKKATVLFMLLLLFSITTFSQVYYYTGTSTGSNIWELGGEYEHDCSHSLSQNNIGIRYDGFQNKNNWNFSIAYEFGHNKSKDGNKETGFALSAGYRYGFSYGTHGNLFAGLRATIEFDNWKDKDGKQVSKETVLVPKIEAGYQYLFGSAGHIYAAPAIGYGYGIHLNATGTESKADEGSRFTSVLSTGYRF